MSTSVSSPPPSSFLLRLQTAKALAAASGKRGITEQIAHQLGKTPACVRHYFTGRRSPGLDDIPVIAQVLGVPPGALFGEMPGAATPQEPSLRDFLNAPDSIHQTALTLIRSEGRTPAALDIIVRLTQRWESIQESQKHSPE